MELVRPSAASLLYLSLAKSLESVASLVFVIGAAQNHSAHAGRSRGRSVPHTARIWISFSENMVWRNSHLGALAMADKEILRGVEYRALKLQVLLKLVVIVNCVRGCNVPSRVSERASINYGSLR